MLIEIRLVESPEERAKEIQKISERVSKGKERNRIVVIMTTDVFAKVFSPKRLELLLTMEKRRVGNVSELAKKLKRKFEVVYRDLKLFEQFGLVKLIKMRKEVTPELTGEIRLPTIAY